MKRLMIVATLFTVALTVAGFTPQAPQTRTAGTALQQVRVDAQTIAALPNGKKYVVDLTRRGLRYEFNAKPGRINFSRVTVKTAQGEVPISSWLAKTFPKEQLAWSKFQSQPFIVGTRATGPNQTTPGDLPVPNVTLNFKCGEVGCQCRGQKDCIDLIFKTTLCVTIFCSKDQNGEQFCVCTRLPT